MSDHTTLIVGGSPVCTSEAYRSVVQDAGYVIAVDAGANLCHALGRNPDVIIGDFDSIDPDVLRRYKDEGVPLHPLPTEKDISDLDAAFEYCRSQGRSALTVTASFAGRWDHALTVCGSLARAADLMVRIEEPDFLGWVLKEDARTRLHLSGTGSTVSVIAVPGHATVTLEGFRYPLVQETLEPLSTRGLSNLIIQPEAHITIHAGCVLVISPVVGSTRPAVQISR